MALLPLNKRYHPDFKLPGRKPVGLVEVDWNHPLSRGLIECFLYQTTNDGLLGTHQSTGAGTIEANYLSLDGSSEFVGHFNSTTRGQYDNLAYFTVFSDIEVDSVTTDRNILAKYEPSILNGWAMWFDDVGPNANDCFEFFVRAGAGDFERAAGTVSHAAGRYKVTGTFDGTRSLGDRAKVFVDGVDESGSSHAGSGVSDTQSNTDLLYVGAGSELGDNESKFFDGKINTIMTFSRVLSDTEIASLSRDPYQILKPKVALSYFVEGAVVPDNVLSSPTVTDITQVGSTIGCTTDTAGGTLHWYVSLSATAPSAADLKAGTGSEEFGSFVPTLGANTVGVSNLTAGTGYYHYWIQETV